MNIEKFLMERVQFLKNEKERSLNEGDLKSLAEINPRLSESVALLKVISRVSIATLDAKIKSVGESERGDVEHCVGLEFPFHASIVEVPTSKAQCMKFGKHFGEVVKVEVYSEIEEGN